MTSLFKKLNFKEQKSVHILNAPKAFEPAILAMKPYSEVQTALAIDVSISFTLVFVQDKEEIKTAIASLEPLLMQDAILWFAYPKASSKKYKVAITRDKGWGILGEYGYEGVRQVSIDEDWSALRFRKVIYIKKMVRSDKNRLTN